MGSVIGRIGGVLDGNDLRCEIEGQHVFGRFGGEVIGKTIEFDFDGRELAGRYGGVFDGKDINAVLDGNAFSGRIGGMIGGADIELRLEGSLVSGRIGGVIGGFDAYVEWSPDGSLTGRFGGGFVGHDFIGRYNDMSPLLAVGLAAIVYYQDVLEHSRHHGH